MCRISDRGKCEETISRQNVDTKESKRQKINVAGKK